VLPCIKHWIEKGNLDAAQSLLSPCACCGVLVALDGAE
jgi:hypothetical protein